jgi:hypothetical protein
MPRRKPGCRQIRRPSPASIAYDVTPCCGGGKHCSVQVRARRDRDDLAGFAPAILADRTRFLIDRRAAGRLPACFGLTIRGLGPFKHLDLALDPEQWGELLYA